MNDILFYIGLWTDFNTTVNIISICKLLYNNKIVLFKQKHLLWYHKPLLTFWPVTQQFYASDKKFTIFINNDKVRCLSDLYEYNNTIKNMIFDSFIFDFDHITTITLDNQWLVIYLSKDYEWGYKFYLSKNDIKYDDNTIYYIINLQKITPCWYKFKSEPCMVYEIK